MQQLRLFDDDQEDTALTESGGGGVMSRIDILSYDHYLVMFSGGKDSVASYLSLREAGVDNDRIELWHHDIDGREGSHLMDWPCTRAYCEAFAAAFAVPISFSWREGGFEREMLRNQTDTAPVIFEQPGGTRGRAGGDSGHLGTRRRFPQVSGNLQMRWCSSSLKIDVATAAIRNQDRFLRQRTLVITGERAEESAARAKYCDFEPDRTDKRESAKLARHVDHHRPIHQWGEAEVWAIMRRWSVNPHPCYRLGWGRCSCAGCIFGSNAQWASLRKVNPTQFAEIAVYEESFGTTIRRSKETVIAAANIGQPYDAITQALIEEAMDHAWAGVIILPAGTWALPAGAFGDSTGPT